MRENCLFCNSKLIIKFSDGDTQEFICPNKICRKYSYLTNNCILIKEIFYLYYKNNVYSIITNHKENKTILFIHKTKETKVLKICDVKSEIDLIKLVDFLIFL